MTSQHLLRFRWAFHGAVSSGKVNNGSELRLHARFSFFVPDSQILTDRRWFALVRTWTPWLAPRQGKSSFVLDKDALLCSFLSPRGKHMVLLGMSGVNNVTTLFRSGESANLTLHVCLLCFLCRFATLGQI